MDLSKLKIKEFVPNKDGINTAHRKEKSFRESYSIITDKLQVVTELRIYRTNKMTFACLWVMDPVYQATGSNKFSNISYDGDLEAVTLALESAGIYLNASLYECGVNIDHGIKMALHLIAQYLGHDRYIIFHAHG